MPTPPAALAAGVPVVTRDLPVLREVFGDATTLARDAGELAARHTWNAAAAAHRRLYASLG